MKRLLYIIILTVIAAPFSRSDENQMRKLVMVQRIIENFYVDSVDSEKVTEEGIRAMLHTLDPHSLYSDKEETKELTTPLNGNFSGIGIQFNMLNDTLYILQTIPGGPSEKVGILAGDRILAAGDSIISGVKRKNNSVINILRGPKGTEIDLKIKRKNVADPIIFRVKRDDIPVYSVDASFMINDSTGFIRLTRFSESTDKEMKQAISKLKRNGMKNLILDLEGNGGGYLNAAVDVASQFLNKGDNVVSTKSVYRHRDNQLDASGNPLMPDGRLVIMVDQYSASAAEILAGAIQDHDRGVIVGRRTFGKGLVQQPFPLPDGSMVRLTISRYYTPSGRLIQKPYTKGDSEDYEMDIYNRIKSGELSSADSVKFDESLKTYTLRNHRTVYGGGGIMPDRFVAIDTTSFSPYYRDLVAKGVLNKFAITYVDEHRKELLKQYPDEKKFIEKFIVTDSMLQEFTELGNQSEVQYSEEGFATSHELIVTVIKALIARDLFETGSYYHVANPLNPIYNEALDIISHPQTYNELLSGQKNQSH
ncbi:MAG: S41 family peptidase [Muribaculaceae bacterium]|nr:S41 family peptidase [Muribaculaceae bacterium]